MALLSQSLLSLFLALCLRTARSLDGVLLLTGLPPPKVGDFFGFSRHHSLSTVNLPASPSVRAPPPPCLPLRPPSFTEARPVFQPSSCAREDFLARSRRHQASTHAAVLPLRRHHLAAAASRSENSGYIMLLRQIPRRCIYTSAALPDPQPWLFVGLGNPGSRFMGTRHNVGFEFIDAFAKSHGIVMVSVHCKAVFGKGFVNGVPVFLAKPQTYMNLIGESSGPLAAYYKLPLNRVLVLHDDMDLPCGVLRLNPLGNHGSHNGLRSVIHHFRGNREFPRLRIGIGRPAGQMDPKAYLLQKFNVKARERIDASLQEGVDALTQVLSKGVAETARCFNKDQKFKHLQLQTMPV